MATSFVARFECAICQGTTTHPEFVSLACGHCFHKECIQCWLAKGSSSCPSCRAHASRRSIRVLVGVETVEDTGGQAVTDVAAPHGCCGHMADSCGNDGGAALRQQLEAQQQQTLELTEQLSEAEQVRVVLEAAVEQLTHQQQALQQKLKASKNTCQELEQGRLQDGQRLTAVTQELEQLREQYRTHTARMKRQLQDEQQRAQRAEADLRRLQLQNPALGLAAIQNILLGEGEQQTQLSAALAQRNEQLQVARARIADLQGQLQQQRRATEVEVEAASSRHKAVEAKSARDKEDALKAVLKLEYDKGRLEQDKVQLAQRVDELQQVLLALQGEPAAQWQQQRRRQHGGHLQVLSASAMQQPQQPQQRQEQQQQQQSGSQEEATSGSPDSLPPQQPTGQQQQQQDRALEGLELWQVDVAAAVGPGSMLRQPLGTARAPSFMKQQAGRPEGCGGNNKPGHVSGQLLRHGPDGRGNITKHLAVGPGKRATATDAPGSKKARLKPPAVSSATGIKAYFGKQC